MKDVKLLMQEQYLHYASYVIKERAIPGPDGLKPVQRRILHTLWQMHNGKLHKVANVAGQTMALHPHGDAPIIDALVNLANRGYLLQTQGNFGNPLTGDPPAAARYIETRLSELALETLFNHDLTEFTPSYDGRQQEPICLPAKIPVLLTQGAEGIAVGMSTHILPHNFIELLEGEIAILEERTFKLLPDFQTGGIMDASGYDKGKGKIKLRVKFDITDPKTVVIREICYGTTTESLIRSIDEAAKKGKIKIDSIHDYTSEKIEIEIKLPRGHYAEELIDALYVYTECEVTITPQMLMIHNGLPWEADVHEILELNVQQLKDLLRRELEIERDRLQERIYEKDLERIFIENRLYKPLEKLSDYKLIHDVVEKGLKPFCKDLLREPTYDDRERLLSIPIRRISLFDLEKNCADALADKKQLAKAEKNLKEIKKFTIAYLQDLIEKYRKQYPRRTKVRSIESVDVKSVTAKTIKVGFDAANGFVGHKVTGPNVFECSNFDKLLLLYTNGTYQVINIPEKQYVHHKDNKVCYVGVADKKTIINVALKEPKTLMYFVKRFVIEKFILDKVYRYFDEGLELALITTKEDPNIEMIFVPKVKQRSGQAPFRFQEINVRGVSAKALKMAPRPIKKLVYKEAP